MPLSQRRQRIKQVLKHMMSVHSLKAPVTKRQVGSVSQHKILNGSRIPRLMALSRIIRIQVNVHVAFWFGTTTNIQPQLCSRTLLCYYGNRWFKLSLMDKSLSSALRRRHSVGERYPTHSDANRAMPRLSGYHGNSGNTRSSSTAPEKLLQEYPIAYILLGPKRQDLIQPSKNRFERITETNGYVLFKRKLLLQQGSRNKHMTLHSRA